MSRVEEIEDAIDRLGPEEQQRWDKQLDSDNSSGKLDFLFEEIRNVSNTHQSHPVESSGSLDLLHDQVRNHLEVAVTTA